MKKALFRQDSFKSDAREKKGERPTKKYHILVFKKKNILAGQKM
jgi:hypothetical protein